MEVQLYVYDLTNGMARSLSRNLLGIQIDAVYHTSLVFDGIEYFFGAGVQKSYAGRTHHGQPMEIVSLGTTQLPLDVILEYLESLKTVYTAESYDLFAHNCNNFSNDFAMFLVGRGIPDHITNLPQQVLDTPFGQMLRPQIDASMRSITQAEVPPQGSPSVAPRAQMPSQSTSGKPGANTENAAVGPYGKVIYTSSLAELDRHTANAANTASIIFFTSSTCAPCRLAYPMFDQLAAEHTQALFLKIDINSAQEIAARHQIRATPTFMTFSGGDKVDEWSGADPNRLKANVAQLMQRTFPPHPHSLLRVSALQFGSMRPVIFSKIPPLEKLMAKLGPGSNQSRLTDLRLFVEKRNTNAKDATLPDLRNGIPFQDLVKQLPLEVRFAAVDLLRCAMIDPRVSGIFAEEKEPLTVPELVAQINELEDCPHNLRLVTIHLACNCFSSPLFAKELFSSSDATLSPLVQLITSSLLDVSHPTTRVAAASLAFNITSIGYRIRREENREAIPEGLQVELAASLLETITNEIDADAARTLVTALGYLIYFAPEGGELMDLCKALDANTTVGSSKAGGQLVADVVSLVK